MQCACLRSVAKQLEYKTGDQATKHSQVLTTKQEVVQQRLKIAKWTFLNRKFYAQNSARKCGEKRKARDNVGAARLATC